MMFTPHQRRALDAGTHCALTANAGSGKTRVLVERFLRVVFDGTPLGEVVALTYTEKAASELRRKIADRVTTEMAAATDPGETARWETIRDGLAGAFIGTIHSFCSRILREFPVEAGVDASFTVMEGVDSEEAVRAAIAESLQDIIRRDPADVLRVNLFDLLRRLGRTRALEAMSALIDKREALERLDGADGLYRRPDGEVLAAWEEELRAAAEKEISSSLLAEDCTTLVAAASGKGAAEAEGLLRLFLDSTSLPARGIACLQLLELLLTKEGSLRVKLFGRDAPGPPLASALRRIGQNRSSLDPLLEVAAHGIDAGAHRILLRLTRTLLALARDAIDRYARAKEESARLDFEDLQLGMRSLLRNDAVRSQLARRFRYVMVDEYQDTNRLQSEILLPLLQYLASGNLFIVGDPKQSIYRFRNADVRVFNRTRDAIIEASGRSSALALGESFRPLRDIAAFVNTVFSPALDGEGETGYDPLVVARPNREQGRVELLLAGVSPGGVQEEAELVARRILALRRERLEVFGPAEEKKPVSFGDVALLLRNRNSLEAFEQAFVRNGIPYQVSAGVGYFQTQDIYDAYNYLRFLTDTGDDVALTGILRSPFFSVSDASLFRLAGTRREGSLWNALTAPEGPARDTPSLERAVRILADDLTIGVRLPVPELLARLYRRTQIAGTLAGTTRGVQALANLEKLTRMARAFEAQGFTGLYDFIARLRRLVDDERREGQAAIDEQTDAVRIMTVHAAKGLEFPVVIIPRLHASSVRDTEPFIDEDIGIGIRTSREGGPLSPIADYLRQRERRRQEEEELRIFYVACTRARDALILSADEPGAGEDRDSWLARVRSAFPQNLSGAEELRADVTTLRYEHGSGSTTAETHTLSVPVVRTVPPEQSPAATGLPPLQQVVVNVAPLPARTKGDVYSASKIRTYRECPSLYFFRHVLGFPAGQGPFTRSGGEEDQDREYPAALRGRMFHAVMEKAGIITPQGNGIEDAVATVIRTGMLPGPLAVSRLAGDVASMVRAVLTSTAWTRIARGTDVRMEFSISAALGDDFITGTIDRLFRDETGLWTVLDYKTDAVTATDAPARAETYWPQLSFYAVMVRKLFAAEKVRLKILFAEQPALTIEKDLSIADLDAAEGEIVSTIALIKNGEFPAPPVPCSGCPLLPDGCRVNQPPS